MESYLIQTKKLTLAFKLLSLFTLAPLNAAVLIPGNNTNINYFGRFAYDDPSSPAFCWSGVGFEAAFTGTSIGVSLTDDQGSGSSPTMYDVWIDGIAQPKLTTDAVGPKKYTISTDLANTTCNPHISPQ